MLQHTTDLPLYVEMKETIETANDPNRRDVTQKSEASQQQSVFCPDRRYVLTKVAKKK